MEDEKVQLNDDGSTTVALDYPIEFKKGSEVQEIASVTIKRPTVGDLEASDRAQGDVGKTTVLIAAISGIPVGAVRKLDVADYKRLDDVVTGYIRGK